MFKRTITIKRMLICVYIGSGAFLLAHTVNAFVADALRPPAVQIAAPDSIVSSEPESTSPRELADAILARSLFPLPVQAVASDQRSEAPAAPLNVAQKVALLGIVFRERNGTMAILEDLATKKQHLYHMGEQVPEVGTLIAIERERVLFQEGAQEEWLPLVHAQSAKVLAPGTAVQTSVPRAATAQRRVLDRREVEAAVADTTRLFTQAQAVPYLTDGKLDGLRLYNVVPLGFFDKLGFQTNDVVQRINGVALRDPGMLLSLFQQLRNEQSIRVDLLRNAERQSLSYEIR